VGCAVDRGAGCREDIGAGEAGALLGIEGVEFGALECEQLGWGSPWLSGEAWLGQLRAVLDLQRRAGRRRFLIAATTETSDELAAVRDAIAVDQLVAVLLTVPPEVAAARIDAREPDAWPGEQGLMSMPAILRSRWGTLRASISGSTQMAERLATSPSSCARHCDPVA
jgi:hypothetical protein